jgi:hypothetical protein
MLRSLHLVVVQLTEDRNLLFFYSFFEQTFDYRLMTIPFFLA